MRAFTVLDALRAVDGRFFGDAAQLSRTINRVLSDSRAVTDNCLFVAFRGERVDGHNFMADCLARGAACCLSEREPENESETPCIVVKSTLTAMGALAKWYRSGFDIPVIGITGSVGKTTTKEMISAVLSTRLKTHKTEKNFNNELGVPQTILNMPEDAQIAVIEMGISDFGEMTRLTDMVRPTIAVISIIGDSHLEFLHDRAGVLRAKTEIFSGMKNTDLAIFNGDDALLRAFRAPVRTITYGRGEWNDFIAEDVENLADGGTRMIIRHAGARHAIHIPAFGEHMVYAALAGAAAGWAAGLGWDEIIRGIADYQTVGNRARLIDTGKITILSDCYNANPNSTAAALKSLSTLKGRHVCILGDMLELGETTNQLHRGVGEAAVRNGIELIIACGTLAKHIFEGARDAGGNAVYFESKEALFEHLTDLIQTGDNVLVKASHSMAFEKIVEALEKL